MREHGGLLAARMLPCSAAKFSLDHVGEARERRRPPAARRPRRPARADTVAGQDAGADQEHLLLAEHAHAVEKILVGGGLRRASAQACAVELVRSGKAPKKVGSISASITWGCCARVSASRGAVPSTRATSATRSGFCRSSENSRPPPAGRRGTGRTRSAPRPDFRRARNGRAAAEPVRRAGAGRRARGRAVRRRASAAPCAETSSGLPEAHLAEPSSVSRSSASGGNTRPRARRRAAARARTGARNAAARSADAPSSTRGEGVAAGIADETRERARARAGSDGKRLGLLVRHHLQPVLDQAQEPVGALPVRRGRGVDPAALGQRSPASRGSRGRAVADGGRRG